MKEDDEDTDDTVFKLADDDDDDDEVSEGDASRAPLHPQTRQQRKPKQTMITESPAPRGYMSVRKLHRALYRIKGYRSMLHGSRHGFGFFVVNILCTTLFTATLAPVPLIGLPLGQVMGTLLTVQLMLGWKHRMLTVPESRTVPSGEAGRGGFTYWVLRLPRFSATFRAVALPSLAVLLAEWVVMYVPVFIVMLGKGTPLLGNPQVLFAAFMTADATTGQTASIIFLSQLVLGLIFEIPAKVVLTRIQASLLMDDNIKTVVPVDRTFGMPGGLFAAGRDSDDGRRLGWIATSFRSMVAAFRSFKGQWVDYYLLELKMVGIMVVLETVIGMFFGLQWMIFMVIIPNAAR